MHKGGWRGREKEAGEAGIWALFPSCVLDSIRQPEGFELEFAAPDVWNVSPGGQGQPQLRKLIKPCGSPCG